MRIAVRETEAFVLNLRARLPFRYGIVTMTRLPHFILRSTVEIDGKLQHGYAADNLPPKWLTKNPDTTFRQDLGEILEVIGHAREAALEIGPAESVFNFWRALYAVQKSWAGNRLPPLLWNFGVTLLERSVIDAFCRLRRENFAQAVRENHLGIHLGEIFGELGNSQPVELLPPEPLHHTIVRHTVGLTDALTEEEIAPGDRVNDGLPEALETYLRTDGITHLKIKLGGTVEADRARLRRIFALFEKAGRACAFTLDGNENFKAVEPFRQLWESLRADPALSKALEHLIFVEQPFHRDLALAPETCAALLEWKDRPPMIIDESDSGVGVLATALEGGYVGTSHKNCKGVFKGIANACLLAHRRRLNPGTPLQMSAEDLTNLGPIALTQDLAVLATLGIAHAERNGHHYFAGLSQFPEPVQRDMLKLHGDLYREHAAGFPTLRVREGKIAIDSALDVPFGFAGDLEMNQFMRLQDWSIDSLGID